MGDIPYCITKFHPNRTHHEQYVMIFKYSESALFYIGPLVIQMICYAVIGKRLFVGLDKLHRTGGGISSASRPNGRGPARALNEAIRARKGVVKMLMASVAIYFLSYSPHQILLAYEAFSKVTFDETWMYLVLTNTLAYLNSAANPLMYCVFSDNFRTKFKVILATCCPCKGCLCVPRGGCSSGMCHRDTSSPRPITLHSYTEYTSLVRRNTQKNGQSPIVAVWNLEIHVENSTWNKFHKFHIKHSRWMKCLLWNLCFCFFVFFCLSLKRQKKNGFNEWWNINSPLIRRPSIKGYNMWSLRSKMLIIDHGEIDPCYSYWIRTLKNGFILVNVVIDIMITVWSLLLLFTCYYSTPFSSSSFNS